ncbi:haloacid dehalogenase-like hydrolase [Caloramator sp. E03]|uniref:DUF7916 family protein n=1 Tax=Caloramator sp. E03 TaxID=2576307 RepID=UPI001110C293|nr:haloacid dehalogenase-like hydrolase [Caloramator sp. E03]QCX33215.1 haloacid dehalogenase-like hydrolase [Caloramator sp. E03]
MKRFIDSFSHELLKMNKKEIINSIKLSEGRVIISEVIGTLQPLMVNISNAELACAFGADILLLNMFDVNNPLINGISVNDKNEYIREIKRLTGRIVGINLEPVSSDKGIFISKGRVASKENAIKARDMGVNLILLTGNPNVGVTNKEIINSIYNIKEAVGEDVIIFAGKMHSSGILNEQGNRVITLDDIKYFIDAGADGILIPAPMTVPGITVEYVKELIEYIHLRGILSITSIGTSQEGSDEGTIRNIALACKMAGADLHHIGDSGLAGVAIPENILTYSVAIRGKRHTYFRMAASINR